MIKTLKFSVTVRPSFNDAVTGSSMSWIGQVVISEHTPSESLLGQYGCSKNGYFEPTIVRTCPPDVIWNR